MVPRPAPQPPTPPLIPQFFAGREVFITGATGFMGKVLVERLLWTCPEVSRLHLLMRRKKDVPPDTRLKQLKTSQVFDVIRESNPQLLDKLSVAAGDITKPKLGLDIEAIQQLSQVSIVFHSAATLKFDEPLAVAVEQNLSSVLRIMDLCDQLPLMQVLVYVSTAYSNAEHSRVEERVYSPPAALPHVLALVDNLPHTILADLTPGLISPKPNTYTFTKAMAESALAERAQTASYATAIFRPSIVVSSVQSPFPGWIENLNGPSGVMVGTGKGLLHVLHCAGRKRADMIPVDIVIDTLIAVAWETGVDEPRSPLVYNCCSYENPTTWNEFKDRMIRGVRLHAFDTPLYYPFGFFTENRVLMAVSEWALQVVPLHTVDFLYSVFGVKIGLPLKTVCCRLRAMNDALQFFMTHEWHFDVGNVQRLRARLSPQDAALYNLDVRTVDWEAHCDKFVQGTRRYVLRESDEHAARARLRMRLLHAVHRALQLAAAWCALRLALRAVPAVLRALALLTQLRKSLHTR